jgi:maleylacetoacetate isomerase
MSEITLYDYWRSSASYRVRIALNLQKIAYRTVSVNLLAREHLSEAHLARNPQGFVPALYIDGQMMTQSLAILEYLNETRPGAPLLPGSSADRQKARAMAHVIAMDIHPVCNLNVAAHVVELTRGGDQEKAAWMCHFIAKGLSALEIMAEETASDGFCIGDRPSIADICLIPQLYNAERWGVDLSGMHRLRAIGDRCATIAAFQEATPEAVQHITTA